MTEPNGEKPTRELSRFERQVYNGYSAQTCFWIEKDGELYLGNSRVVLLERLDKLGSIAAAARSMHMTYRNAWLWIEAMNRLAPSPLVQKSTTRVAGKYAWLTDEGCNAITAYKALRAKLGGFLPRDVQYDQNDSNEKDIINTEPVPIKINHLDASLKIA